MASLVKINDRLFFDDPDNPTLGAKAFVETDNDNESILVSLNESKVAGSIKSVFAGVRKNKNGQQGILVTVIFSDKVDPHGSDVFLTVQQDGSVNYGPSVPFVA